MRRLLLAVVLLVPACAERRVEDRPGRSYFSAEDFSGDSLSFDLPGPATIILVPGVSVPRWRNGEDLGALKVSVSVSIEAIDGASRWPGRPILRSKPLTAQKWTCPKSGTKSPLPETRAFQVYDQARDAYVAVEGRLAFDGGAFAFYEESPGFTAGEYRALNEIAMRHWPEALRLFGEPSDVDGNGRILVFIGRSVKERHPAGEAYFDPGVEGEIVYFWSPDGFESSRDLLVRDYYPRNILHEAIHVCQSTHALRKGASPKSTRLPAWLWEGMAEHFRFRGMGEEEKWKEVRLKVAAGGLDAVPFLFPYPIGGLYLSWLHRTWGDGVHQALLEAAWGGAEDPVRAALGVPEALSLAMMWADQQDRPPAIAPGERGLGYTEAAIYRIRGPSRVRVTVADRDRACVVIVPN